MKIKVKILEKTEGCMPEIFKIGDWIDLRAAQDVKLKAPFAATLHQHRNNKEVERKRIVDFQYSIIPLGVAMQLPEGYEAHLLPRSSTFGKFGILMTNSTGIIDCSYASDKDEWKMPVLATKDTLIPRGERVAQFRIVLSQKATIWQKIKWLFSSSIELVKVDSLDNPERGGLGEGTKDL